MSAISFIDSPVSQACSWPTVFKNTIWHDGNRGEVTFTETTLTGWSVSAQGGQDIDTWECFSVNETSSSTLTFVLK